MLCSLLLLSFNAFSARGHPVTYHTRADQLIMWNAELLLFDEGSIFSCSRQLLLRYQQRRRKQHFHTEACIWCAYNSSPICMYVAHAKKTENNACLHISNRFSFLFLTSLPPRLSKVVLIWWEREAPFCNVLFPNGQYCWKKFMLLLR